MMAHITFFLYLLIGNVIPMHEEHEGRDMYVLKFKDGGVVEHCYKEEIIEYIQTGTFEYNDFD
jgi:hypothetical protein